jgi:uncharacterized protein YkwD
MTRTTIVQFAVPIFALLALAAPASGAVRLDRAERSTIHHINSFRAAHGLAPVRKARALNRSAERHSSDMWMRSFFNHTSSDGTPFHVRVRRYVGERAVGETIALISRQRRVGAAVYRMWRDSPPHRAIMLEPGFRRIGVARVHGRWTADFASSR